GWPLPANLRDSDIAERLVAKAEVGDPRYLVYADLLRADHASQGPETEDLLSIAVALGRAAPPARIVDAAERAVGLRDDASALALPLGRALRLKGQLGRA